MMGSSRMSYSQISRWLRRQLSMALLPMCMWSSLPVRRMCLE